MATAQECLGPTKAVFLAALEVLQINRLFRHLNRGKVKVLLYHSITPRPVFANGIAPSDFEKQVRYLRKHYHVVNAQALDDPKAYVSDRVNVVLTFDDGFKDNRTIAADVLQRAQLTAIFFVIADCLERGDVPNFVRARFGAKDITPDHQTIDCADAIEMRDCGMEIGAHGVHHDDYAVLDYQAGMEDAAEAQRLIHARTGLHVENFAFPWGRFREGQEKDLLCLYRRIFLTDHGFNNVRDRVMLRNEVSTSMQLRAAASGSLDFFRAWF